MSMQTPFAAEVPQETRRLVEPLQAADSVYRRVGIEMNQITSDEDFLEMYATEGHPAVNPVVLVLVSVFQFLEKLPDRASPGPKARLVTLGPTRPNRLASTCPLC